MNINEIKKARDEDEELRKISESIFNRRYNILYRILENNNGLKRIGKNPLVFCCFSKTAIEPIDRVFISAVDKDIIISGTYKGLEVFRDVDESNINNAECFVFDLLLGK